MATAGDVVDQDLFPLEGSAGREEARVAGNRDCASSMLAGLGTAGIFSARNRFPLPTAARTAKMGAKAGLAFGVLQDGVSLLRGRRVGYVEFVKRYTVGSPLIQPMTNSSEPSHFKTPKSLVKCSATTYTAPDHLQACCEAGTRSALWRTGWYPH